HAVWPSLSHLSGPDARRAANRLHVLTDNRTQFSDTLLEEKWCLLAGLQSKMREPGWRWRWPSIYSSEDPSRQNWLAFGMLLPYSRTRILNDASSYMDAQIEAAKKKYGANIPNCGMPAESADLVGRVIYPIYSSTRFRDILDETENRLLYTALAIR